MNCIGSMLSTVNANRLGNCWHQMMSFSLPWINLNREILHWGGIYILRLNVLNKISSFSHSLWDSFITLYTYTNTQIHIIYNKCVVTFMFRGFESIAKKELIWYLCVAGVQVWIENNHCSIKSSEIKFCVWQKSD